MRLSRAPPAVCRPGWRAVLVTATLVLGAGPGAGWQRATSAHGAGLRWPKADVVVVVEALPADVDHERARAAVARAAAAWGGAGCGLQLTLSSSDAAPSASIITIRTVPPGSWTHDLTLAAHTAVVSDDDRGYIQSAVISVRGDLDVDVADPVAPDRVDLETLILHELGHALGLAHSFDRAAVMHAGIRPGERQRAVAPDDVAGLCAVTGKVKAPREAPSSP